MIEPGGDARRTRRGSYVEKEETMDNVSIIRSGYEAFGRGDIEAVLALFDPEIEWNVPDTLGLETPARGVQAVGAFFRELSQLWQELHVEPKEIVAIDGDRVLALGTHRGRVADGEAVEIPFAHVWTLRDGRPVRFFEYADAALVLRAQGLLAAAGV
jgi:ketosteroid isomerase-like protein